MFETRRWTPPVYLAIAALILAVLAVDTLIWTLACRRLDGDARAAAADAGWTLSSGVSRWGGWPFAAEITLQDTVLQAGPDIIPPLTWAAPLVTLRLSLFQPTVLAVLPSGTQTLAIGAAAPVPFTAASLRAAFDLTTPGPVRIVATALDIALPDGAARIGSADLRILPDGLVAELSGMVLPGRGGQPIDPPIDTLKLAGRISPPIEPRPTASDSATAWRATGGAVTLDSMSLRWGPLEATGAARLTLDADLQPAIAGHVAATGLPALVERLADTGALPRPAATAAQGMLVILSAPAAGGPVTLPVTLADGTVSIARIPLLRLAPIRWE